MSTCFPTYLPCCRLSCIADAPVLSGPDCTVVASANAAERVAAALDALGGYFSTADGAAAMSKPRPTVMDYHNSYKAGMQVLVPVWGA
jgi:hypothetical protein